MPPVPSGRKLKVATHSENHRRLELDGLRGVAIALVLFHHLFIFRKVGWPDTLNAWIDRIVPIGAHGVDVFFVLSGFLIGSILLRSRTEKSAIKTFYVRRAFRILPIYWLLLLSYFAAVAVERRFPLGMGIYLDDPIPFSGWRYVLFFQGNVMASARSIQPYWLMVTWSLAIEEQFYLLAPWVVRICSVRTLTAIGVAVIAASPLIRVFFLESLHNDFAARYLLISKSDGLAAGLLVAVLLRDAAGLLWLQRHSRQMAAGLTVFAVLAILEIFAAPGSVLELAVYPSIYSIGSALVLIYLTAAPQSWLVRALSLRPAVFLGGVSYFVYLFHFPIQVVAFAAMERWAPGLGFSVVGLALIVTLILGALSRRYLELPLIRCGHRLTGGGAET